MECHESLMQRRRKRTRGSSTKKTNSAKLDKSLPSLPPPDGAEPLAGEIHPDTYAEPTTEVASRRAPGARTPQLDSGNTEESPSRQSGNQGRFELFVRNAGLLTC